MGQSVKKKSGSKCEEEQNLILIDKIFKSFEALEETLSKLQLQEPLFITYMAKKSFADSVFAQIQHHNDKNRIKKFLN